MHIVIGVMMLCLCIMTIYGHGSVRLDYIYAMAIIEM